MAKKRVIKVGFEPAPEDQCLKLARSHEHSKPVLRPLGHLTIYTVKIHLCEEIGKFTWKNLPSSNTSIDLCIALCSYIA